MRTSVLIAMVVASGCGGADGASVPPKQPALAPTETRDPWRTSDGAKLVDYEEMPWCYADTTVIVGGGCEDTAAECETARDETFTNDVVTRTVAAQKRGVDFETAKKSSIERAAERWSKCERWTAVACLNFRGTLTGITSRVCYTRMADCARAIEASRNDEDIQTSTTCSVLRGK